MFRFDSSITDTMNVFKRSNFDLNSYLNAFVYDIDVC